MLGLAFIVMCAGWAAAQSSSAGAVIGTVTDSTGAAIPGAALTLTNTATGLVLQQGSNASGGYEFASVVPGTYTLAVTATGFQRRLVKGLAVEVNKTVTVNAKLTVGQQTQTVEVTATSQTELQTVNATVGNVIGTQSIDKLPTLQHDTVELLSLQPTALTTGSGNTASMRVNGAIDDQNTIRLDGVDISGHVVAGAYQTDEAIPTPVDSVEEFRVGVADNGANFGDSSGGDVTMVGRRGTNDLHGSAYWYNQNQHFNANSWTNNRQGIANTPFTDNRFGARIGGPIRKNKDFFFFNYEGRRFPQTSTVTRVVPTQSLRNGILSFKDASGATETWNLATAQNCGPSGTAACDPRGIGISPAMKALLGEDPLPNNNSVGDGLNTAGFTTAIRTPQSTDYEVLRLDHTFNSRWQMHTSETYYRNLMNSTNQVDVLGGQATGTLQQPQRAVMISAQLVGQISPNLTNDFTFGYMRDTSVSQPLSPTAAAALENLPGTNTSAGFIALQTGADGLTLPIDNSAGAARFQWTKDTDIQYTDNATWLVGNHTYSFGTTIHDNPVTHARNDAVVAGNSSLAAVLGPTTYLNLSTADEPQACGTGVSTNCIPSSSAGTWDALYGSLLGMVDNVNIMAARDASLNPLPFGTTLQGNAKWYGVNFYASDSWRATPNLTLDYGFNYGFQTPPIERNQKQVLLEAAGTGQVLTATGYLGAKAAAAASGQFYNPTLAYVPIKYTGQNVFRTDWGDFAPRLGAAWNPGFTSGLMGGLFGNHKSVLRAGLGMVYDRTNMVQNVEIPMLGVGFGQVISTVLPTCSASGAPGTGCSAAASDPALSSFRVGVDGSVPLPSVPSVANPAGGVIPGINGAVLSFQLDPQNIVGRSLTADLMLQRQLSNHMLLELGWSGNFGRDLPEAINFNNAPIMFRDNASGQTFAAAYDAVVGELQQGTAPASVAAQPWFQDLVPGGSQAFVSKYSGLFNSASVSSIFNTIDSLRAAQGEPTFDNRQVGTLFMRTHQGISNYNAFIVTLRMDPTNGLNFDFNYTRSKLLSNGLGDQDSAGFFADSYNTFLTYGVDSSDRTNTFNATYTYNLPGVGGDGWLNKLTSGWYHSGVVTFSSGAPLEVSQGGQVFGGGTFLSGTTYAIPTGGVASTGVFANQSTGTIATHGNVSSGGLGENIFANPGAVYSAFRTVQLGVDGRSGNANPMRGFGTWNWDGALGKSTQLSERVSMTYTLQVFNVLNHPTWNDPSLSLFGAGPANFGVLTSKGGSRTMEMGLRFSF
jgi:hypothetical protein